MEIKRKGIYLVDLPFTNTSIENGYRPCVVVSNNANNKHSTIIHVIPLSEKKKAYLPTRTSVEVEGRLATALCESLIPVNTNKIGKHLGDVTISEMIKIEKCIKRQFGLVKEDGNKRF